MTDKPTKTRTKKYASGRDFLMDALNSPSLNEKEKVKVAIALFRTEKRSAGRVGKKEEASDAARELSASGRFATPDAPRPNGGGGGTSFGKAGGGNGAI